MMEKDKEKSIFHGKNGGLLKKIHLLSFESLLI